MKGRISDIKRFAIHDGPGIRTTVFFKGCPLKCRWCHNPESISRLLQIGFYQIKCIGCGECVSVCPSGSHKMIEQSHSFNRTNCILCGKCADVCPADALIFYGKEFTAGELIPVLTKDKIFYENSGGGVTLSGGEPLMQADFCAELLKRLNKQDIHTAVDTCGYASRESVGKVMPYTDLFLYDVKAIDEDVHIECTGQSNKIILDNLKYIDEYGKAIEIRIPYVPEYTDGQMEKIAGFLSGLKNIKKVKVLPYHNYAGSKYESLGMDYTTKKIKPPSNEQITTAVNLLRSYGLNAVGGNE